MNGTILVGVGLGVLAGLIFVAVILVMTKKDGSIKCKYDERQDCVRGKGFKFSFFTLMIYDAAYGLMGVAAEKPIMDEFTAMMLGICIAVAVYAIYCIWNEAYFSLNESPKRVLLAFAVIAAVNLLLGITNLSHGELVTNGMLNFKSTNLMCGILFFAIFLTLLLKKRKNNMEAE